MKIVAAFIFLLFSSSSFPQAGFSPEQLLRQFKQIQAEEDLCQHEKKQCDAFERDEELSKSLGLSLGLQGCSRFVAAHVRLDGVQDGGFVRMQCGEDLNMVFIQKSPNGWGFLQTLAIPNKYWEATVTFKSVTGDASEQILVHKAQYDRGSGIGQQNFVVYKLIDNKLRPVLDVVESAHVTRPWVDTDVFQESQFVFEPPSTNFDSPPLFREIQTLHFSGTKLELKRSHEWSKDRSSFTPMQWVSVKKLSSK